MFATPAELPYVLLLKRKRKVKFQEVIQSEKLNSSNIIDQIESPLDSTKEFLATMVGYLQQLQSAHRLDYDLLVIENMELYRKLVRDDKAMLESRILSRIEKASVLMSNVDILQEQGIKVMMILNLILILISRDLVCHKDLEAMIEVVK